MRKLKYLVILLIAWIYIQSTIEPYPSIPVSHPNEKVSWGIGKVKEENGQPRDCVEANHTYTEYGATFVGSSEPIIYLTFDNGYENGNTHTILDILKREDVQAVFFVTGDYAREEYDLIQRMIEEGHGIGNHSFKHLEYASISSEKRIEDLQKLHTLMEERYHYTMSLFRFPKGEYSIAALQDIHASGYRTLFWSFAYYDYNIQDQPSNTTALSKLNSGLHPGAIYLLHAVSDANMNVLEEFIQSAKAQGYTFALWV
ncbi:MAG: polysaccharide deacetylase [Erysipelotrichaceae bacterium]|nr:polysaccharide deacetylase [Erysipelotrichaceae bacterium]